MLPPRHRRARALVAPSVLACIASCSSSTEPGAPAPLVPARLIIVSGAGGADTVMAPRQAPLVLEVRDSSGRARSGIHVRVEVPWTTNGLGNPAAAVFACTPGTTDCGGFRSGERTLAVDDTTDAQGRVRVATRHGNLAARGKLLILVGRFGLRDSVMIETRPGRSIAIATGRDTTLLVGRTFTPVVSTRDEFGNPRPRDSVTFAVSEGLQLGAGGIVTAAAEGPGLVIVRDGDVVDTMRISVAPPVHIAAHARVPSAVVVQNLDGSERRVVALVTGVRGQGARPVWAPGGASIFVHDTVAAGNRVRALDVTTGAVRTVNATTPSGVVNEWHPDAPTDGWVHFVAQGTDGTHLPWRMRHDGSEASALTAPSPVRGGGLYRRIAVSPDGSRYALMIPHANFGHPVAVAIYDYASGQQIGEPVIGTTAPRWSPDGQWLAVTVPYGSGPIRIVRADGSQVREIPGDLRSLGEWLDWTPDGRWLVVTEHTGDTTVRLGLVRVADGLFMPLPGTEGLWQPAVRR